MRFEILSRSFLFLCPRFSRDRRSIREFDPLVGIGSREFAPRIRVVDEVLEEDFSFPESNTRRFDGSGIVFRGRDPSSLSLPRDVLVDEV